MLTMRRKTLLATLVAAGLISAAGAETRKEFRFTVSTTNRAIVSVDTRYGAITVKPGPAMEVSVIAVVQDKAKVDHLQKGNRIELETQMTKDADRQTGRVDYELIVPPNATVSLRSSTGPMVVERLRGDVTLEGSEAPVEVRNSAGGGNHIHVKTMNGPITLTEVRDAHVEITSISGDIRLNSVTGELVQVNSGSGKIVYDGDFGQGGDYDFSTHTGDIEAVVPTNASADFNAHSMKGEVQSDVSLTPSEHPRFPVETGRSFFGTIGKAASEVVFKSISGRILLKRR